MLTQAFASFYFFDSYYIHCTSVLTQKSPRPGLCFCNRLLVSTNLDTNRSVCPLNVNFLWRDSSFPHEDRPLVVWSHEMFITKDFWELKTSFLFETMREMISLEIQKWLETRETSSENAFHKEDRWEYLTQSFYQFLFAGSK